ncbi:vanadium-dependent haloperoxidase [Saccharothrix carnea]|uniref:vanadium-dependent haloperoxidase n=1 Tax=Saccharothrix carnea TaxID=1280637 RepID=UPI000D0E1161|nr:vanadium-dependent haloperoxidase [Saccharothrix carnea]
MFPLSAGISRRRLLIATAGVTGVALLPALPRPAAAGSTPDLVGRWFDEMLATAASPAIGYVERIWAMSWLAAGAALGPWRAVPQRSGEQSAVYEDAAVATAVHGVLKALVPEQAARLDTALAGSLAGLPGGAAKEVGIVAGREAAAAVVRARADDRLDPASVNAPFTPPPEAPGVYRFTPGVTRVVGAGYSRGRPFLIQRADRFRPPRPPALGTDEYRRDLAEVRRLGGQVSERTEEQSDLAWLNPLAQYLPVFRSVLGDPTRSRADKVRLLVAFGVTVVDSGIALFEAKYFHLHWRPITAIRAADTDGDPLTDPDPTWASNLPTPAHPEYPSGHTVTAAVAEQVFSRFVGPSSPVTFSATYTRGDGKVVHREYRRGTPWTALTRENVDSRVYAGVHFRFSDEVGATLGRRVAYHNLRRLTLGDFPL